MSKLNVNYIAIAVAAVSNMIIGFLWYSPLLFGKPWMKLSGFTEKSMEEAKKGMGKMYALSFVIALVMAYVLAFFVSMTNVMTITDGITLAFWTWLGFVATVKMADMLYGKKPLQLYLIESGYYLVALVVMAIILVSIT